MTNQSSANSILELLVLVLIALLLCAISRVRDKYRPRPATCLPISRQQIEAIVYRQALIWHIPFFLLVPLFMFLLHLVGRISLGAAIASSLVVLIIPAWSLYVLMYLQWRPLRSVPYEFWIRLEREIYREKLQRLDDGWQFSNWCWYIRVSKQDCVLLRAELIDFEKPVRHRPIAIYVMGFKYSKRYSSNEYIFTGKDGSIIRTRTEQTPLLTKWVKNHGGRFE